MKKLFSSLFLTLALGVLLGAFCDVSKASNYNDLDNYFYNEIQYHDSTFDAYYEQYKSENEYFYTCEWSKSGTTFVQIFFTNYNGLTCSSFKSRQNAAYTMAYGGSVLYLYNLDTVPVGSRVYCISAAKNSSSYCVSYAYTTDVADTTSNYDGYSGRYARYNFSRVYGSNGYFEEPSTPIFKYIKGDFNFYYNYSNHILEDNFEYFVEDDRLEIYTTYQANDEKLLNIDLSKFREIPNVPNLSFEYSDLNLVLNCDGVDVPFVLDDNNSNIVDILSNTNNVYTVITNYNLFGLDEYSDVFISSVSFSLITTLNGDSYTENYNIACQYYLKQEHIPLEPEEIPDPEYNDTSVYTDQQITDMKSDLHKASSRFSFISGDWVFVSENDLPSFPDWATVFTNYVWFGDVNSDTTYKGHWFQMANNIPSIADLSRPFDPSEFIEENKTFAFYDVILLKVYTVGISVDLNLSTPAIQNYSLAGYLVLISDRYYDHYNAEINLDIVKQLQLSAENSVLFYEMLKKRLDDLAEDMDTGFNGLTDINDGTQYKIIGWLKTIDTNITSSFTGLGSSLSSGFDSVVSAINNISIPSYGSSYSLPALSDELEYLFKPTLEWSAINYDDYVESLGVLALPFEFTFDVLDIAESQYDPDLKLHINNLSVDVPLESGLDPETYEFTVLNDQDVDFQPTSVIPASLWSTLQYLNAFGLVLVQALGTYNHIFRGGDK